MALVSAISGAVRRIAPTVITSGAAYLALKSLAEFTSPDAKIGTARSMQPLYETHKPTTVPQKAFIAIGSALMSFGDPTDGSHIAALGDVTSNGSFGQLKRQMLSDATGRRILKERPDISFAPEQWEALGSLPESSFGYAYYTQMKRNGISWTTRPPVRFVDNEEDAYILLRFRQCHDFYHTLLDMDISVVEELAIKIFEWRQTNLPVGLIASLGGPLRLPTHEKERFFKHYLPWAIQCGGASKPMINAYWEEMLERDIDEVRKEMGIWLLPERNSVTHAENSTATQN
ncbi:Ubiquinone biosynthesis protein [Dipsacomyces acuminosporus]|nr:Ubiquinone biosynthesis protein [Dipsacomyces acuminosporus]